MFVCHSQLMFLFLLILCNLDGYVMRLRFHLKYCVHSGYSLLSWLEIVIYDTHPCWNLCELQYFSHNSNFLYFKSLFIWVCGYILLSNYIVLINLCSLLLLVIFLLLSMVVSKSFVPRFLKLMMRLSCQQVC